MSIIDGNLSGRRAVVTGGAQGIGRAIAARLLVAGARVCLWDDDGDRAAATASELGEYASACPVDVAVPADVSKAVEKTLCVLGGIDILVNNAGISGPNAPTWEYSVEDWQRVINIDLNGVFYCCREVVPVMRETGYGRIINIASVAGIMPLRLQCAFVAAKAGVVNLTKAMAIELASSGIIVNGIAPGSVLTEGTKELFYGNDAKFQESMRNMLSHVPLGRPAETEEIAHAALFLADPETSYITGHVLVVDGGWTAGYIRDF